jgi:hypothetical protein
VGDAVRAGPPRSASDDWGPYRVRIEEQVAGCADYLGRIRRSLAGAIAGDRIYLAEKAQELMSSAKRLVRLSENVERWLDECGAHVEAGEPGDRYLMACGWPAGRDGPQGERSTPPAQRASDQARRLADRVEQVSQRLGWLALEVDTDLALRRRWTQTTAGPSRISPRTSSEPRLRPPAWRMTSRGSAPMRSSPVRRRIRASSPRPRRLATLVGIGPMTGSGCDRARRRLPPASDRRA